MRGPEVQPGDLGAPTTILRSRPAQQGTKRRKHQAPIPGGVGTRQGTWDMESMGHRSSDG